MTFEQRKDNIIEAYKKTKEDKVRLQERQKILLEDMQKEFGVATPEELSILIDKTKNRIDKLEARIEPALCKLEGALDL